MLTIYDVTSATDAKKYYASSVSPGAGAARRDYYAEGQESPGRFGGKLGEELGLAGKTVDKETFDRLCDNLRPDGRPLTPRTNGFRRVCKDFTFSGPKSFSIIEAFASEGERQRLRQAFDEAINETVTEEIEPDMRCRERANGADHDIVTGNALTAGFDHYTSRADDDDSLPDMQVHRHLLVWNATRRPDGRIMAGQLGDIVRDKGYYRAAFYARLAGKLEGLGYAIDRRGGNEWEIAGVPQSAIDTFSKRTSQIEAEAARRGITDAASKAALGAKIRAKKQKELTLPELRAAWDAQLTSDERDALAAVYRHDVPPARQVSAKEAVAFAIGHGSEQLSVMPEREVKRVALLHGLGSVTPEMIAREMQGPAHGLIAQAIDGRRMVTTLGLQAEEDAIIGFAARGLGAVAPVGLSGELDRLRPDGKPLNDGQWGAVCGLLESENRVNLVQGPAGAGKTDMLGKYRQGMTLAGQGVTFLASSSDAVEVLHRDGFKDARTVAHFLLDDKMQAAARGGRVVIDESSMLGHKDAVRLFAVAKEKDLKLIFLGDPMQHGSVPRGALMRILTDYAGVRPFKLTRIMRQQHAGYLQAAGLLSQGRTLEGFDALDSLEWVKEEGDDQARYQALAAEYAEARSDGKTVLVVSPTHAEAGQITDAIRSELRAAGTLGAEDHAFTRLVPVNASEAERGQASTYRPGDVIQFHQNAKGGFKKGDRLTVEAAADVPLSEAAKFSLYRTASIGLAEGDLLRFTGTVKTLDGHTLKNGAVRTVTEITKGGSIRLDNGWLVPATAGHFRHGVVETSFGSQGKTVQRVILGMSAASSGAMNQEQMYVSASRGKERLSLYTDDKEAVRSAIQRSSRKLAAKDLKADSRPKPAKRKWWEQLRQHLERRRRQAYGDSLRPKQPAIRDWWDRLRHHQEQRRRLAHDAALRPERVAMRPPVPPVNPPSHAERARASQQERNHSYER